MIDLDLEGVDDRRKVILGGFDRNPMVSAAKAIDMVSHDVPALVAEIIRLNNELIAAQLRSDDRDDEVRADFAEQLAGEFEATATEGWDEKLEVYWETPPNPTSRRYFRPEDFLRARAAEHRPAVKG